MNKDATVYKIFAELGIDFEKETPDPIDDRKVDQIIHPEEHFLDAVEDLFKERP